ncbi:hypothetical protein M9458_047707, partial [Cirrhinus mrigala]
MIEWIPESYHEQMTEETTSWSMKQGVPKLFGKRHLDRKSNGAISVWLRRPTSGHHLLQPDPE